jgi:hypothetical protein
MTTPYPLAGQRAQAANVAPTAWTAMTLINSWANVAGLVSAQYRFLPLFNELEVVGTITHASISGTSQFCSTFTQYLPASTIPAPCNEVILTGQPPVQLAYLPSGVMEFVVLPAGSTRVFFHHCFPLDA